MGVPRQLTQIAFAAGLDESTEDEILDPTVGFPVLRNVRQDRRGGLSKRLGFAAQSTERISGSARSAGRKVFEFGGGYCVSDGTTLDIFGDAPNYGWSGPGVNVSAGRIAEASVTTRSLAVSGLGGAADVAVCNGFIVSACRVPSTGEIVAAVETLDGTVVLAPTSLGTASSVTLGVATTYVLAIYTFSGSSTISYRSLNCSSVTTVAAGWSSQANLATDKRNAGGIPDGAIYACSLSASVAVAYVNNSAGSSRVTVHLMGQAGSIQSATINTSSVTPDVVGVGGTHGTLWVCWNQGLNVYARGLDATSLGVVTMATAQVHNAYDTASADLPPHVTSTGSGTARMIMGGGSTGHCLLSQWGTSAGAISGLIQTVVAGALPMTTAFTYGGRSYCGLMTYTDSQAHVVCDFTAPFAETSNLRPVAFPFPALATNPTGKAHIVALDAYRYGVPMLVTRSSVGTSVELVILDFADPQNTRSVIHNGQAFLSGGVTMYCDRQRVVEANFLHAPPRPEPAPVGSGTGPTGNVRYVAVYDEVDASGNYNLSGASIPSLVLAGAGDSVDVAVSPLAMTARRVFDTTARVRVSLYRTVADGTIYYYVGSVRNNNQTGTGFVTIRDTLPDASLTSRPLLYGTGLLPGTGGAPLQREAPPYCADVATFNGMLVIASGSELRWSGQTIGGEGTWFSSEFALTVDGPGNIVALAVQDGTLYVFKERAIYVVGGEAPSDNNTSGGLGAPRRLAGDVGCIRASSVVVTGAGIWFQSYRGIELLAAGRASWIGEPMLRTLATYPIVTSAVIDERNNLVRFSLAASYEPTGVVTATNGDDPDDGSGGGVDVVYDLTINAWQSVDDKASATGLYAASQDACTIGGRYAWLGSNGVVHLENETSALSAYRDPSDTWITMSAETGWFKVAGIQGRQMFNRLLTLMRRHTPSSQTVQIGYEYRTAYETAQIRPDATLTAIEALSVPLQLRTDPSDNAEGMAIRVKLTDAEDADDDAGTGRGCTWLAMTLDITPREGPADVPEEAA